MESPEPFGNVTVASAGYRQPVTVDANARLSETIATMREHRVGCVVVLDGDELAGIFTERDLVKRVYAAGASLDGSVRDVMTADPLTTLAEAPLFVALAHMHRGGFRHLPVLDSKGKLVGTTSIKRTMHFLAEHMAGAVLNLPPDPGKYPATEEGG